MTDVVVLVVDDDPAIRRVLDTGLRARDYTVVTAATGSEGVDLAAVEQPDVVILDLGLPDVDGVEVCRRIRGWSNVPIIVLSAHGMEERKIEALDEGADDFVTKPFNMRELLARIRVAVRHRRELLDAAAGDQDDSDLQLGPVHVDLAARRVHVDDVEVTLTEKEFDILAHLGRNAGRVITHAGFLDAVWGPGYDREVHYLRVYVSRLRHKLAESPATADLITTVPGVGYRLELPAEDAGQPGNGPS